MHNEIELTFEASSNALRLLERKPWFCKPENGSSKRETLVSVYFDTDKSKLRKNGITLRVRHIGKHRLQTIKAASHGAAGLFGRKEWEVKLSGHKPDLGFAHGTALEALLTKSLERKLKPVFETSVSRTSMLVHSGGSHVELAIDRGTIKTGKRSARISEIELELKKGTPDGLLKIAEWLAKALILHYGAGSKADRGYALADGQPVSAVCADEIYFPRDACTSASFKLITLSCLRHLCANRSAVLKGDPEGIHQMRVALRRLRAVMSVFKDLLRDRQSEKLKGELKWLTGQLESARDLDVFVKETVAPFQKARPQTTEMIALRDDIEKRRTEGFAKAKSAVESDRYRKIILSIVFWVAGGHWLINPDKLLRTRRERPISAFAKEVLTRRTKRIIKKLKAFKHLDARSRHKGRIAVKQLRYASEFFAHLFVGAKTAKRRKAFAKVLETLQNSLGTLSDIRFHHSLADDLVHSTDSSNNRNCREKAYAIGLIAGKEQIDIEPLISTATKAAARLVKTRPFWLTSK